LLAVGKAENCAIPTANNARGASLQSHINDYEEYRVRIKETIPGKGFTNASRILAVIAINIVYDRQTHQTLGFWLHLSRKALHLVFRRFNKEILLSDVKQFDYLLTTVSAYISYAINGTQTETACPMRELMSERY
jgi:hypothetical protein